MEINPDLIRKLLEDKADPAEWEAVMNYLSRHPEAMEKLFPAGEWQQADEAAPLPEDMRSEMLQRIRQQLFNVPRKTPILRFTLKRAAAAAILLFIAGAALWQQKKQKHIELARTVTISEPTSFSYIKRVNNSNKPMTIHLPDGSSVRLQSHASLHYDAVFGATERNVYLQGNAFFEVVKDRERPFTVFAGPLRTTVLGTSFRINTSARNTEVKLFTGKVVVTPVNELKGWKQDIYLSPGERLSYDRMNATLVVAGSPAKKIRKTDRPVEPQEFVFSNAPLNEVMDQLSNIYHYKIVYDYREITGMNFTGTISRSDSLVVVLKLIATMNELELREEGNSYVIARSPK